MASEPLEQYLGGLEKRPELDFPHTACWRGYHGTWSIEDNRLYLIELRCYARGSAARDIEYIFPNQRKVFAGWFTGEIRIPKGEMLKYVHSAYESVYERDLFLKFENGVLVDEWLVDNRIGSN